MAQPENKQVSKWREKAEVASARAAKAVKGAAATLTEQKKKQAAILRQKTESNRMSQAGAIVGAHATAVVAGQIHRELGQKRAKPGMARGINYAAGLGGALAAIYGKSNLVRSVGAAATGMSIFQVGQDTAGYDLVPGFNEAAEGGA